MIDKIFEELKVEARTGEVKYFRNDDLMKARIQFNIVDDNISTDIPNFYIKDSSSFNKLLYEYTHIALKFYNLELNYNNVKKILSFLFVNITKDEMNCLEEYLIKYINFYEDQLLKEKNGEKNTTLGNLKYEIDIQSFQQETPYCFKSYFDNGLSKFALPRISFGISNGVCYVYAIQNKDSKINANSKYNFEVKEKLKTINRGISKYRNVTPSFVVALSLFLSVLKENDITQIKVVTPLPIRQKNREFSSNMKIKFYAMRADITKEEVELFKKEVEEKRLNDDYNSTIKFVNCFNRLKLHFDNIFLNNGLDEEITLSIIDLITKNEFLTEIVKEKER